MFRFLAVTTISALISPLLLSLTASAEPLANRPGVCNLHNLGGYLVIDASGNLVPLPIYCQQAQPEPTAPTASREADRFWQTFNTVASSQTLDYANRVDRQSITAYAATICPYLEQGGTLQELRQLQSSQALPAGVDVAITVAAIHSYCPAYRSAIGQVDQTNIRSNASTSGIQRTSRSR